MGLGGVLGAPLARRFNSAVGRAWARGLAARWCSTGGGLAAFSLMPSLWGAAAVLVAREINFAIWWTAQQDHPDKRTEEPSPGRIASYETLTTLMMVGSILASGAGRRPRRHPPVAAVGGSVVILAGYSGLY